LTDSKLYKGESMADELRRMLRDGRVIIKQELPRWRMNRSAYNGDEPKRTAVRLSDVKAGLRTQKPTLKVNRLRQFVDGRVAQYAANRPPFEVVPDDRDQASLDRARLATRFLSAMWGEQGWAISRRARQVATWAEIDGIGWWCVVYERGARDPVQVAFGPDGNPIVSREQYESLRDQGLVEVRSVPMGEVTFRPVRPGALSVDPLAVDDPEHARWIIESCVRRRADVEAEFGVDIKKLEERGADPGGGFGGARGREVDSDYGDEMVLRERDAVIVHKLFAAPQAKWPKGAHIEWLDIAPDQPLIAEEWPWRVPYFCFVPRPGPSHFIRSRGSVDELRPIQVLLDRWTLSFTRYLDKVGNPTWSVPQGALISDSIYNDKGYFEYHPGLGKPEQETIPGEPASMISHGLAWCIDQMGEMTNLPPVARGIPPGQGVEAALALRVLDDNKEQQLSGTAAQFVAWLERSVSFALERVALHYSIPRMVMAVGVDSGDEFVAFTGDMIRGATRFRVAGSVLPKQRAAQLQTALQLLQIPEFTKQAVPYISNFIGNDLDELVQVLDLDRQRQRRETRKIVSLGGVDVLDVVWREFQQDVQAYAQAMREVESDSMLAGPDQGPRSVLAGYGIEPPRLTDRIRDLGFELPTVEDFDNHAIHVQTLDEDRKKEAYDEYHPAVKQLLNEHAQEHARRLALQMAAMGQQYARPQNVGSQPAEKGEPSPPRERGIPGGQFGQPLGGHS
jgi:hypothetical protein